MKLLFDQNISYRIVHKLSGHFPECKHLSNVGILDCEDPEIWQFARKNNYAIVTFDSDFYEISLMNGCPPKIIWLRTGNLTTDQISQLLTTHKDLIDSFLDSPEFKESACLEIK